MKILLLKHHGYKYVPEEIRNLMGKANSLINSRVGAVVEYMENNCVSMSMKEFYNGFCTAEVLAGKIFHFTNGLYDDRTYCAYDIDNDSFSYYEIFDVDTSRPWVIRENEDGSEDIMYIDLVDKDKNFYGFIDE